jgi:hypothetical protein
MSTFAQILDGQVHWIFQADTQPVFAPYIVIKDITNVNPQPQEGWNYDATTNTYSEPVAATPVDPAPPAPTLEEIQANQLTLMSAVADLYTTILGGAS